MAAETLAVKVGPWGGSGGDAFDIKEPPKRLLSVTFQVGRAIHSISFKYVDLAGQKHIVGPFGVLKRGKPTTIEFAPTEYVKEFSGHIGSTADSTWLVTDLKIETNLQTHEMYYQEIDLETDEEDYDPASTPLPIPGIPFSIPLPENTSIVGFFGRSGSSLDAIGVYVKQNSSSEDLIFPDDEPIVILGLENVPVKIGAWGGDGGTAFDLTISPSRLESMTIRSGDSVDSFGFSYLDQDGLEHTVGPCGGTGGELTTIQLGPEEYVKNISGRIGSRRGGKLFVASLEIETNTKNYGPYGKGSSNHSFSILLPENVRVVGFFGRAGLVLDAIGLYVSDSKSPFTDAAEEASVRTSPQPSTITGENFPIKIGTWGWGPGAGFDATETPKRLESVMIRSGDIIDSFGFSYVDEAGKKHTVGPCGGRGGSFTTIKLEPSETVVRFSGTTGKYGSSSVVASLKIETNLRAYGPYGKEQDTDFSILLPENGTGVVGFFGCADNVLQGIGVYVSGSVKLA